MKSPIKFISVLLLVATAGCAEKKVKLWIEPPQGIDVAEPRSLNYEVEDINSGKKENISIPINQAPDHFVVQDPKKKHHDEAEMASATPADRQIQDGKLVVSDRKGAAPTVSYLRGVAEVEKLYQKKQHSEALVKLAPLIEQYPQQSRLYIMQGTLFRRMGEKRLALDSYKKAQTLEPGNPSIEEAVLKSQDDLGSSIQSGNAQGGKI